MATVPDLDIVLSIGDPWAGLVWHRSVTHSLFFAPVAAPLLGWLAWLVARKEGRLLAWVHLAFWALITHPILDAFTSYGTLLLWPFSDARFAWDAIAIVDPVYTLPLLAVTLYAWRRGVDVQRARALAVVALVLSTLYIGVGRIQHDRALNAVTSWSTAQGMPAERMRAMPTLLNILVWRVIWEDAEDDVIHVAHTSVLTGNVFYGGRWSTERTPPRERILEHPRGELARWFMVDWVAFEEVTRADGTPEIRIHDVRYGAMTQPTATLWGGRFLLDATTGDVREATWEHWGTTLSFTEEARTLGRYLVGAPDAPPVAPSPPPSTP